MEKNTRVPSDGDDGADLVRRFREGDERAFRELYERYAPLLQGRVRRLLPDYLRRKVAVSDVMQESALVAFRRSPEFASEDERAFRSWLLSIAENKAREAIRHHLHADKRSVGREVTLGGDTAPRIDGRSATPSHVAMRHELRDLALEALECLPTEQARVLRYSLQEHLTVKEMAVRLERSENAVKKLHGRAIVAFRKELTHLRRETHA